jgi:hypothetical protein
MSAVIPFSKPTMLKYE